MSNMDKQLDDVFTNSDVKKNRPNNYSLYIDYYVPSDIYELESDKLAYVFGMSNGKLIMNINIEGIINDKYNEDSILDDGFFDEEKLIYSKDMYYFNKDNEAVNYRFSLYQYDDYYLLHFVDRDLCIYGYSDNQGVVLMAQKIMDIVRSTQVDENAIVNNYSNKDVIDYHKNTVNLFETIMPISGRIDDMMIENND